MRHITFALLLPSAIHSAGIISVLRKFPDSSNTIKELSAENYIEEIDRLHPSVIIVDPLACGVDWEHLKNESGSRVVALLSQKMPKSNLSFFDDTISVYDAPEQIHETIGRNITDERNNDDRGKGLSPREKEVIIGIVKGLSNKEIAAMMNVSVNTVMTHRRNIAAKLHIHTPAGLTIYAIVSNLVSLDEIKADLDRL